MENLDIRRTFIAWRYAACILCWVSSVCFATEGYKEISTGAAVLLEGYDKTAAQIDSSPVLKIDVNRNVHLGGTLNPIWRELAANDPEVAQFVDHINVAIGLWENLPSSRLNFAMGSIRGLLDTTSKNGVNLATMTSIPDIFGLGITHLALNSQGQPRIVERDFTAPRGFRPEDNPTPRAIASMRGIIAHEIGHTIGFNHSFMANQGIDGETSPTPLPGSIMSYGSRHEHVANGALAPEDVALAARLYPRLSSTTTPHVPTLSRTTGAVQGKAMSADGASEIYGANVLLIEAGSVNGVASRISGYAGSRPGSSRRKGTFHLDGVPPGTYDILVAAHDDRRPVVR